MSKLVWLHFVIVKTDGIVPESLDMYGTYVFDKGTLDELIKGVKQPIIDQATNVGASISFTLRDIKVFDNELPQETTPSVAE